jgi:hypothetical protein
MTKVTWNELHTKSHQELKEKYKISDRQLEQQVRRHLDGANKQEREKLYKTVWDKK